MNQIVVALTNEQVDYLLNLLAVLDANMARVIYDQLAQAQMQAIEEE